MNRKNIIIIISILAFIVMVGGVSYSYFMYNKNIGDVSINTGDISINFSNTNGNQTLTNIIPLTDYEGMNSSNYFDFTVTATVDTEKIYYEVYILPDSENTLDTSYLKIYLTDQNNNQINRIDIYDDLWDSEVENGKLLYKGLVETNNGTTRTETKNFRLRLWLDENYTELTSKTFDFDIYLYAKNVDDNYEINDFKSLIASKVSESYVSSYDAVISSNSGFTTQDTAGENYNKQTVYYYTGDSAAANANVLFAGYCWQIVRTTDNGGVKLIYDGVAVNNKCETSRVAGKGVNGIWTNMDLTTTSLYGRSYDYNLDTGVFTIIDSTGLPTTWNDNNYKSLIGTYTCLSNSTTCTTMYEVGNYRNSTQAWVVEYVIGNLESYSFLGSGSFNADSFSPSSVGYMFNKTYDFKEGVKSGEYYQVAAWDSTNSVYVLSTGNGGTAPDATHHYICDTTCSKVRYYYYANGSTHQYVLLEDGIKIEDALKEMINYKTNPNDSDGKINVYNSSMKGYLENWYRVNLTTYSSFIDNTATYCNNRYIENLGGWNPTGGSINSSMFYYFATSSTDLSCMNKTDRFSVSNKNVAELTYSLALLTESERNLMTPNYAKRLADYYTFSPTMFSQGYAYIRYVYSSGAVASASVGVKKGIRPVITLKPGTEIEGGTGTYDSPYVVGPIVERTN